MPEQHMEPDRPNSDELEAVERLLDDEGDPDELTGDLVAYLDGELDRQGSEAVSARISLDATVRSEATALKKAWDLLDHLPRPEPSPSFTERTLSRIEPLRTSGMAPISPPAGRTSAAMTPLPPKPRRTRMLAGWALMIAGAGIAGYFIRGLIVDQLDLMDQSDKDRRILADQRLLQNMPAYRHVDDLNFLRSLDDPDLFGNEEPSAPVDGGAR